MYIFVLTSYEYTTFRKVYILHVVMSPVIRCLLQRMIITRSNQIYSSAFDFVIVGLFIFEL